MLKFGYCGCRPSSTQRMMSQMKKNQGMIATMPTRATVILSGDTMMGITSNPRCGAIVLSRPSELLL